MKFVNNAGQERVIDLLRQNLAPGSQLDVVSSSYSLFAYVEVMTNLAKLSRSRLIVPPDSSDLTIESSRNRNLFT